MTNPPEGATVSYIGDGRGGLNLGDHGRILAHASMSAGHVQWLDGARRGQVDVVDFEDIAPSTRRVVAMQDGLEDSLEVGPIVVTSNARHVFDVDGGPGLISLMASTGRLASFDEIADEAFALVQDRVSRSASVREVLAELDEDDRADVVHMASLTLLHDAFGGVSDVDE